MTQTGIVNALINIYYMKTTDSGKEELGDGRRQQEAKEDDIN